MRRIRNAADVALRIAFLLATGVWIWLEVAAPTIKITIPADAIQPESGYSYTFRLPSTGYEPLFELRADGPGAPAASRLVLLEDRLPLGPAHAMHAAIRDRGRGAFSHWGPTLFFSSSDLTSPVENGRAYSGEARLTPSLWLRGLGALAIALLMFQLTKQVARTALDQRILHGPHDPSREGEESLLCTQPLYRPTRHEQLLLFTVLVMFAAAVLSRLVDQYYVHVFEPDAQTNIDLTLAVASGSAFSGRPEPGSTPPYFDAQYYVYAVAYHLVEFLRWTNLVSANATPTPQSIATLGIRFANVTAYCLSVGTSFLIFRELSGRFWIALLLAAYMLLSPHMLDIDLMRVDHVILAFFLINFYLSLQVAKRDCGSWVHVLFGVTAAVLSLTKITSVFFLLLPLMGYAYAIKMRGLLRAGAIPWTVSFGASALLFLSRYIPHEAAAPGFTLRAAQDKLAELAAWNAVLPLDPRMFYNWDQFHSYGPLFLAVSLVSIAIVVRRVLGHARTYPDVLILTLLGLLSLIGFFSFKYSRGLYVIAPLYLAAVANAFSTRRAAIQGAVEVSDEMRWLWQTVQRVAWFALLLGLVWPIAEYRRVGQAAASRQETVRLTKLDAREWLSKHLWPGARITVPRNSEWANPPLDGLDYDVRYRFLDFPYLDPVRMIDYRPPTLEQVEKSTDAIILNDFHVDFYLDSYSRLGRPDRRLEWEQFFERLRKTYLVKRFEAAIPAYRVRIVEVIVVHSSREFASLEHARTTLAAWHDDESVARTVRLPGHQTASESANRGQIDPASQCPARRCRGQGHGESHKP